MVDTDDTQPTMDDRRWTMPRVWHKLPTGELKITVCKSAKAYQATSVCAQFSEKLYIQRYFHILHSQETNILQMILR